MLRRLDRLSRILLCLILTVTLIIIIYWIYYFVSTDTIEREERHMKSLLNDTRKLMESGRGFLSSVPYLKGLTRLQLLSETAGIILDEVDIFVERRNINGLNFFLTWLLNDHKNRWLIPHLVNIIERLGTDGDILVNSAYEAIAFDIHLPLLKWMMENYKNYYARYAAAIIIANTVRTLEQAQFLKDACYDREVRIADLASARCSELGDREAVGVFLYIYSLSAQNKTLWHSQRFEKIFGRTCELVRSQGYAYWKKIRDFVYWDGKFNIDREAMEKGTPIDPITRTPLTEGEVERLHDKQKQQERRLADLRETWRLVD